MTHKLTFDRFYKFDCGKLAAKNTLHNVKQCLENYPNKLPNVYFFTPDDVAYFPYDVETFK